MFWKVEYLIVIFRSFVIFVQKSMMDIRNKTRSFRPSKRFQLFVGQWEQKQLVDHKDRVRKAAPRIDFSTPASASYEHIRVSYKTSINNKSQVRF